MSAPLKDHPYLTYYLQDILFWYRNGSAGGSRVINSHMKNVRIALKEALASRPAVACVEAQTKPVCFHLERALDNGLHGPASGTTRMLSRITSSLSWGYGYERMPRNLEQKYAYSELMGPRGLVQFDRLILGVVLLAPGTTYPAHSHAGITESYLCLSGTLSQNDAGVYAPGSMIYNPPEHSHRITTDRKEPCLLSYAWTGSEEALANQNMTFKRC
ncbi:dimethylsulfonioproprionate lyase family protein [Salidesulfovibrio brasiliensis]|uniref:dimethylsulfonioproprionate lyase family protein n=1 Tax=Salidesulfovibrio brasiliensis TaxID=221711 RepID=UPI001C48DE72|nr:dimethylsulfonioproprionate lyase family protein [Salidesulfovibrio brasiliensis]